MIVHKVMKTRVVSISATATLEEAIRTFVEDRVGTLPVRGPGGELLGVLDLQDVLALVLPPFVKLVSDFDFVHDFGPIEFAEMDPATRARPVSEAMAEPHAVEQDSGLPRAYAFMRQHALGNVPVTDRSGKLVGIASQVDIGVGFLRTWLERSGGSGCQRSASRRPSS